MNNLRNHIGQLFGTVLSSTSALTAWEAHVDFVFRVGASGVAIVAGLLTIRSLLRKR